MFVREAMQRFDQFVGEEDRIRIMQSCGYNCAKKNHKMIERAVNRRKKFSSIEEFLKAEQEKPMKGTKLVRNGNVLYQYYTPQKFTRPMRCYCGLLKELPKDETVSITYCSCSKGFVEKYWEEVLGKPVKVDVIESAVSGAEECKFAVHI